MEEFLSSQEFYELMQDYRNAPYSDQDRTIKAFEAVKTAIQVQAKVKPEIAEVIKMINEEWRTVDSYDKTTFIAVYNKDRELSNFAKLVLESLKEKIEKQFSV